MPDLLFRLGANGQPVFRKFAGAIAPAEFAPGKVFGSGEMTPIDYAGPTPVWPNAGLAQRRFD